MAGKFMDDGDEGDELRPCRRCRGREDTATEKIARLKRPASVVERIDEIPTRSSWGWRHRRPDGVFIEVEVDEPARATPIWPEARGSLPRRHLQAGEAGARSPRADECVLCRSASRPPPEPRPTSASSTPRHRGALSHCEVGHITIYKFISGLGWAAPAPIARAGAWSRCSRSRACSPAGPFGGDGRGRGRGRVQAAPSYNYWAGALRACMERAGDCWWRPSRAVGDAANPAEARRGLRASPPDETAPPAVLFDERLSGSPSTVRPPGRPGPNRSSPSFPRRRRRRPPRSKPSRPVPPPAGGFAPGALAQEAAEMLISHRAGLRAPNLGSAPGRRAETQTLRGRRHRRQPDPLSRSQRLRPRPPGQHADRRARRLIDRQPEGDGRPPAAPSLSTPRSRPDPGGVLRHPARPETPAYDVQQACGTGLETRPRRQQDRPARSTPGCLRRGHDLRRPCPERGLREMQSWRPTGSARRPARRELLTGPAPTYCRRSRNEGPNRPSVGAHCAIMARNGRSRYRTSSPRQPPQIAAARRGFPRRPATPIASSATRRPRLDAEKFAPSRFGGAGG
jgi:hypothetical protein